MFDLSFNHIAISVRDTDRSVEFYQRVLELEEIPNTASNSRTRWLSLGEGKELHLIHRPNENIKMSKSVHFALATPDIYKVVDQLKKLGIEFSDWNNNPNKIHVRDDGILQIYFQDIDGYWVEINTAVGTNPSLAKKTVPYSSNLLRLIDHLQFNL